MNKPILGLMGFLAISLACGGNNALPPVETLETVEAADSTPAWLIAARAAGASVDDDACDFESPLYTVIKHLNTGMADDPILARTAVNTEPEFEAIRSSDAGRRWVFAQDVDISTDDGIRAMLAAHPAWTQVYYPIVPRTLSFEEPDVVAVNLMGSSEVETGTWTVQDGAVHVELLNESWVLTPQLGTFYMALDGGDEAWAMNPVVCL